MSSTLGGDHKRRQQREDYAERENKPPRIRYAEKMIRGSLKSGLRILVLAVAIWI